MQTIAQTRWILVFLSSLLLPVSPALGDDEINGSYFAVVVGDIDSAAAWYSTVLQLEEITRFREAGRYEIVNLQRGGLFVELLELSAAADRPEGTIKGPFKIGMLVADLAAFVANLPEEVAAPEILSDTRNGVLMIQVRDPDKNIVQVMELVSGNDN